jgi:hypothetical protein
MIEQELQDAVIELSRLLGWRVAHFRPAKTANGWRTPVEADGKGFPDLVLVRGGRLIFAELKSATGKLSDEQEIWVSELRLSEAETYVWEPSRWLDGTIERVLR